MPGSHNNPIASAGAPAANALPPNLALGETAAPQNASLAEGLIDIRGPLPPAFWEAHGAQAAWGAIALVLAGLVLFLAGRAYFRRRKRPLTAAQKARLALAAAAENTAQSDRAFSAELSEAVRVYIEEDYGLPAPERTTEEFLGAARQSAAISPDLIGLLGDVLALCDEAKFARAALGAQRREQALKSAEQFVEKSDLLLHPPKAARKGKEAGAA